MSTRKKNSSNFNNQNASFKKIKYALLILIQLKKNLMNSILILGKINNINKNLILLAYVCYPGVGLMDFFQPGFK